MSKQKILIVEDDSLAGEDLRYQLERLGYEVPTIVPSALKAMQAVELIKPDLVLMDIFLEGDVDGIQAAAQINERWDVPIVFMSIYSDTTVLERAKLTNPFGYIVKPYTERELHAVLSMALYKANAESKLRQSEKVVEILDTLGAALVLTDEKGCVISANNIAELLLDTPGSELEGKWLPRQIELRGEEGSIPLAKHLDDIVSGKQAWLQERGLRLVNPLGYEGSLDLTISSNLLNDNRRGAAVLLQVNDLPGLGSRRRPITDPQSKSSGGSRVDGFTGTVSHDLRAPLGELQRYIEKMMAQQLSKPMTELAVNGLAATRRMHQLIQDLVIYMRLGRGALSLERVNLEDCVQSCIDECSGERDQAWEVALDTPMPMVLAHRATLVRIITQLLKNGLRFTAAGKETKIRIRAEVKDKDVQIWIEDNGVGMSGDQSSQVLRLFYRQRTGEVTPGPGIGLAIVERAIEWMGGAIGISGNANGGSRVCIQLPVSL